MMPLPEEGKEKISIKADEKTGETPKVPNAASSSSNPATRRYITSYVEVMVKALERCSQDEGIAVDAYIDLYEQVIRFLDGFGSVFGFLGRGIYENVNVLRMARKGENKDHYQTVQCVLQGYRDTSDQELFRAGRALLQLHRPIPFASGMLRLINADFITDKSNDEMVAQAEEVFNSTIAKYATEDARKVTRALLSLLLTSDIVIKHMQLLRDDSALQDYILATVPATCDRFDHLFEATQKLFAKYDMLNLI